jgi:hypothetical protein
VKWLWVSLALTTQHADGQPASSLLQNWSTTGRVVNTDYVHVGVRPAAFVDPEGDNGKLEWGVGVTAQLTVWVL